MPRTSIIPRAIEPGEVVSLAERLGRLQGLRVGFVIVVSLAAAFVLDVAGGVQQELRAGSVLYLATVAATELVRRRSRRSSLATLGAMLLVDGAYLAFVTYATGGTESALHFLLYVHLVAVTLLASYRTGLKIALWHSLLSIVALYAQAAELIAPRESAPGVVPGPNTGLASIPVFNVTAFWIVALVTAAFSSLNERELRRRRADSEALATMATEMEQLQRPGEIAEKLLEWLGDGFGFGRAAVIDARDGVRVLAARGAGELGPWHSELGSLAGALKERKRLLLRGIDPIRQPALAELLPDAKRVLVLPLLAETRLLGAVALEHTGMRGWSIERRIVDLAAQFAAYGALALRNAWLLEQIQQSANTDGLTGVANRRMFDVTLARELDRARREGSHVSLLMLDVDHFKRFNDEHGHLAGDEALQAVAGSLAEETRGQDLVARYGGEEFGVILPGCPAEESLPTAERLLDAVRALTAAAPLTASIGIATFPDAAGDAGGLIEAADAALYESKRAGRDRLTAA